VLKVRGGCYNYSTSDGMWLQKQLKQIHHSKTFKMRHVASLYTLILQYDIHKNALKNEGN
jgi:hypothetical protein